MSKISIIIPVYNEINTLEKILDRIERVDFSPHKKEIIIVDDCSNDGTRDILKNLENKYKTIYHDKNYGKGRGMRTGYEAASGDYIMCHDADLEYNPENINDLIKSIEQGDTKVVYGSRIKGNLLINTKSKHTEAYYQYYFGGRILTLLTNILYNAKITDEPTCYKIFKSEIIKNINLKCKRFEFCPEVTAKVRKKGYKIYEVPIRYNPRTLKEGKKIKIKDGLEAVWALIKYRFIN